MRTTMALTLALLLGGCATQADRAAQQQREVDDMIAVYGPACEKLGNMRDSEQWRSCILTLDTKRPSSATGPRRRRPAASVIAASSIVRPSERDAARRLQPFAWRARFSG